MKYRLAILSISLVVVAFITSSFGSRSALGLVVDACEVNSALTGSPYPCLKVVQAPQPLSAYAILREPTHKERTIFVPLADVPGIEDPRLLAVGAPNYFGAAWKERESALSLRAEASRPGDFALAINAASWRTQDHLHIHMGCATSHFRNILRSHQQDISKVSFTRLRNNDGWWVKFFVADDLSNINPFDVVADGVEGARSNMKNVVIGVFGSTLTNGQHGFYVLTRIIGSGKARGDAEDMIDPRCAS